MRFFRSWRCKEKGHLRLLPLDGHFSCIAWEDRIGGGDPYYLLWGLRGSWDPDFEAKVAIEHDHGLAGSVSDD